MSYPNPNIKIPLKKVLGLKREEINELSPSLFCLLSNVLSKSKHKDSIKKSLCIDEINFYLWH